MLATLKTEDFIYTCQTHLTDPGFASQVGESTDGVGAGGAKMGLSPEEIAKVKEEWEERQKKKQELAKQKEKETDKDKKENDKEKDKGTAKTDTTSSSSKVPGSPPSGTSTPSTPSTPLHQRYTLHRDIFALRLAEHRKRRQVAQARELAPRLPGAPRGSLPSSAPDA